MNIIEYMRANRIDTTMTRKEIKNQFKNKYARYKADLSLTDFMA